MTNVFRGWKRKIGVVTLSLSSILTIGWVNSFRQSDLFTLPVGPLPVGVLISSHGTIGCSSADPKSGQLMPTWEVSPEPIDFANCGFLFEFQDDKRHWRGLRPMTLIVSFGSVSLPSPQNGQMDWKPEQLETAGEDTSLETAIELVDDQVQQSHELDSQPVQNSSQQINLTNATTTMAPVASTRTPVTLSVANTTQQFTFTATSTLKPLGIWSVPYWSIVIPLTILTLWLLLSKGPSSKRIQRIESITERSNSSS